MLFQYNIYILLVITIIHIIYFTLFLYILREKKYYLSKVFDFLYLLYFIYYHNTFHLFFTIYLYVLREKNIIKVFDLLYLLP
jgi:hypothetical protein